jgi:O-antigen/teichoic acid export membrane protein
VPFAFSGCPAELDVLWRFSLPSVLGGLVVAPSTWIANAMLANTPAGYGELGILNAANSWFGALLFLPNTVSPALFPVLTEALKAGRVHEARSALRFSLMACLLSTSPAVLLALASPWIVMLYGEPYRDSWPVFLMVMLTTVLYGFLPPLGSLLQAQGRAWVLFFVAVVWGAVFVGCTAAALGMGAMGWASARFIAYVCHNIMLWPFCREMLRNPPLSPRPATPAASAEGDT